MDIEVVSDPAATFVVHVVMTSFRLIFSGVLSCIRSNFINIESLGAASPLFCNDDEDGDDFSSATIFWPWSTWLLVNAWRCNIPGAGRSENSLISRGCHS